MKTARIGWPLRGPSLLVASTLLAATPAGCIPATVPHGLQDTAPTPIVAEKYENPHETDVGVLVIEYPQGTIRTIRVGAHTYTHCDIGDVWNEFAEITGCQPQPERN